MRLATWVLRQFGVLDRNESLVGDLEEEYQAGRSAWWVWRQVWVAITGMVARDVWKHKLLALRAIAVGWICMMLAGFSTTAFLSLARFHFAIVYFLTAAVTLFAPFVGGWLVGRLHPRQQAAMVLCFCLSLTLPLETSILLLWGKPIYMTIRWEALYHSAVIVLCALVGGFLARPRQAAARRPPDIATSV